MATSTTMSTTILQSDTQPSNGSQVIESSLTSSSFIMPASANDVVLNDDNVNNKSVSSAPASDPKQA